MPRLGSGPGKRDGAHPEGMVMMNLMPPAVAAGHLVRLQRRLQDPGQPGLQCPDGRQEACWRWPHKDPAIAMNLTRKDSPRQQCPPRYRPAKAEGAVGVASPASATPSALPWDPLRPMTFPNAGAHTAGDHSDPTLGLCGVDDILKLATSAATWAARDHLKVVKITRQRMDDAPLQMVRYKGYPAVASPASAT